MTERPRFRRLPAIIAALLFVALAYLPWVHTTNHTPPWVAAVTRASLLPAPPAPPPLPPVSLSPVAQPVDPSSAPAKPPSGDATFLATLVSGEENRLRSLLHAAVHLKAPRVVDFPGAVATLVLAPRPTPYQFSTLVDAGAAVPSGRPGTYILVDSVFVAPSASLQIGGSGLKTLLMNTSPSRFTSIVTWEGTLSIEGSARTPLTIIGWNNGPATDPTFGRPYIRDIGGRLTLKYVQTHSLGFWSGLTGGVAWSGTSYQPATGGATSSAFVDDTYGAFVSGSLNVHFVDDRFQNNQMDGLRLHRNADNSTVTGSSAVRNGGNGFVVSRGSHDALRDDVAIHNAGNGFLLEGQALISGASPTGSQTIPSSGLAVTNGEAVGNGRAGILVEGGAGTVVADNIVCGSSSAIAVRLGATGTAIVGNNVRCGKRIALSIGPGVTGTTVSGNTLERSHIGILIRYSSQIRLLNNHLSRLSVFGVAVRGTSHQVAGVGNVIAGKGFAPIQTGYGAQRPVLISTNLTAWQRRSSPSVVSYLRYHPLLATWLAILAVVALLFITTRLRRRPTQPYKHVVAWQPAGLVEVTGRVERPAASDTAATPHDVRASRPWVRSAPVSDPRSGTGASGPPHNGNGYGSSQALTGASWHPHSVETRRS